MSKPYEIVASIGPVEVGRHTVDRTDAETTAITMAQKYAARHPLFTLYVWQHTSEVTKLLRWHSLTAPATS